MREIFEVHKDEIVSAIGNYRVLTAQGPYELGRIYGESLCRGTSFKKEHDLIFILDSSSEEQFNRGISEAFDN